MDPVVALFIDQGVMGVDLFFVVSAYSLCLSWRQHEREALPVVGFALRRFFRIAPLFYLLAVAVVVLAVVFNRPIGGVVISAPALLLNATLLFNLVPGYQTSLVPAGWTIGTEVLFYAAFPFLVARIRGIWSALTALALAIVIEHIFFLTVGFFVSDGGNYHLYSILYRAPIFMFGFVAFYALPLLKARQEARNIGFALLALCPVLFFAIVDKQTFLTDAYFWNGLLFGTLVVGLGLAPIGALVNRVTAWLGTISYSIYLCHMFVIIGLLRIYPRIEAAFAPYQTLAYIACAALTLTIVVPLSLLLYRFFEHPINEWGKKLASRAARREPVTVTA